MENTVKENRVKIKFEEIYFQTIYVIKVSSKDKIKMFPGISLLYISMKIFIEMYSFVANFCYSSKRDVSNSELSY